MVKHLLKVNNNEALLESIFHFYIFNTADNIWPENWNLIS